jgi:hypothetical protein
VLDQPDVLQPGDWVRQRTGRTTILTTFGALLGTAFR